MENCQAISIANQPNAWQVVRTQANQGWQNKKQMNYLEKQTNKKLGQWRLEAEIAACRAIQKGIKAWDVMYPSGLHMKRFAKPFSDFGMHYEVEPKTWDRLVKSGGIIAA